MFVYKTNVGVNPEVNPKLFLNCLSVKQIYDFWFKLYIYIYINSLMQTVASRSVNTFVYRMNLGVNCKVCKTILI